MVDQLTNSFDEPFFTGCLDSTPFLSLAGRFNPLISVYVEFLKNIR